MSKSSNFKGCKGFMSGNTLMITDNAKVKHTIRFASASEAKAWAERNEANIA